MTSAEAAVFQAKANRALQAARLLVSQDQSEGACNRAYYAMFYSAQAALLLRCGTTPEYKTHRGLVAAFGKTIVRAGLMDAAYGRSLNEVQKIRELADYLGDPPPTGAVAAALRSAERFVAAVDDLMGRAPPDAAIS